MLIKYNDLRINRLLKKVYLKNIESLVATTDVDSLKSFKTQGEEKFSSYIGCKNSYFLDSGTTALKIALYLSGVRKDDEVIMPVTGWASPALAILSLKAKPVFVDIKEDCTIDEKQVKEKITEKTKAILPVHLFGHLCNMDKLMSICKENNLNLVEDACQSHGSTYKGKKTGTFGKLNAFSFEARKSISGMGTGGALTFNEPELYEKINQIINFTSGSSDAAELCIGQSRASASDIVGILTKLRFAQAIEKNKTESKNLYLNELKLNQIKQVSDEDGINSIRIRQVCYCENKEKLQEFLKKNFVLTENPYLPTNKLKIFSRFAEGQDFPNADYYYKNALHLPLFSMMTKKEVLYVIEKIKEFYK